MLLNEEDAKKKECPVFAIRQVLGGFFASYIVNNGGEFKANGLDIDNFCKVSNCMMWMWDEAPMDVPKTGRCGLCR